MPGGSNKVGTSIIVDSTEIYQFKIRDFRNFLTWLLLPFLLPSLSFQVMMDLTPVLVHGPYENTDKMLPLIQEREIVPTNLLVDGH